MKIAVIGTGISGLVCAYLLHGEHELTVYEANDYVGGHTNTVTVPQPDGPVAVDTGFIVFNRVNYPAFCKLLDRLGVDAHASDMSFSVRCDHSGLEYRGSSLNTLFAQRRNLLRPSFYRLVLDVLRFFREAHEVLDDPDEDLTLRDYLVRKRYSQAFIEQHILPMGAALWSATPAKVGDFPARFFVGFLHHHRMLQVRGRPTWQVVTGGSRRYVEAMTRGFADRIRLRTPVRALRRESGGIRIRTDNGTHEMFDEVIVAAHSDQALGLLEQPTAREREILAGLPYQENEAVLHTDPQVMPRTRRAWASWNYHIPAAARERVAVTYQMNLLQGLSAEQLFFVSLNPGQRIRADRVIQRITYHHPVYTVAGFRAQQRRAELIRHERISYCGAYWGFGFHEDGVRSALEVCRAFGKEL